MIDFDSSPEEVVADFLLSPIVARQQKEQQRQYKMAPRTFHRGCIIELGNRIPVYDDNEKVIGKTNIGDRAVVTYTYVDAQGEHAELVMIDGQYLGYDAMCINKYDIKKAKRIKRFDEE